MQLWQYISYVFICIFLNAFDIDQVDSVKEMVKNSGQNALWLQSKIFQNCGLVLQILICVLYETLLRLDESTKDIHV